MNEALQQVINRNDTWRGSHNHFANHGLPANCDFHSDSLTTGYRSLDGELQQGGWPLGNTIELLSDGSGLGSMGLFLPAMEKLSAQGRWQVFIAPPFTPYAPLLEARGIRYAVVEGQGDARFERARTYIEEFLRSIK